MTVAFAVPPPSQIACTPYRPPQRSNSLTNVVIIFVPVQPRGCPRAIAPPQTFNLSKSAPSTLAQAKGTGAKASLTSYLSISLICKFALANAFLVAGIGPSSIILGQLPATARETIFARGIKLYFFKALSLH